MYPVSSRFLPRIAESTGIITQVLLFTNDGRVLDIAHTGGSVPVDRSQAIRRTCTITSADLTLMPRTVTDELATYGARLRPYRGVDYGDGTQELVPLGLFRLDAVSGDPTMGPVTLTGTAIEVSVQQDAFTAPYRATGTVVSAVTALILRSVPDAQISVRITDATIASRLYDVQGDPWAAVQEIAAVAGAECYTDNDGVFVLSVLPDVLTTPPVWEVAAGEGGVYVSGTRGMSSTGVTNGVYAYGDNTAAGTAPVAVLVTDDDPGSPTRWGGPFGRRPSFYQSSTLLTNSAATAAATVQLVNAKKPNRTGDFSALPNPALQEGDVIRVSHPDGLRELHQAAAFTVPLDAGGDFPITTIAAKEDG